MKWSVYVRTVWAAAWTCVARGRRVRKTERRSVKTHPSCWTAAERNDVSGSHPTHEMRLSRARVRLRICKCCSHYVMQASEPQQERLWHVCFQQQISEGWESYGDLPTADVNNAAKSTERWPRAVIFGAPWWTSQKHICLAFYKSMCRECMTDLDW